MIIRHVIFLEVLIDIREALVAIEERLRSMQDRS